MAFDVDKELEALMENIKAEEKKKQEQPVRPAEQRPVQQRPAAQRPAQPQAAPQAQKAPQVKSTEGDYYSGEVYFAAKKPVHPPQQTEQRAKQIKKASTKNSTMPAFLKNLSGTKAAIVYVVVLVALSAILSAYTMSFVNDVLALNRSDETKTITVSEGATTNDVIKQLKKAGLIKHRFLCMIFMDLTEDIRSAPTYLSGVYYLTPSMGLEKMLMSCQEAQTAETVTVTIPEGFTIEQIANKLEKAGVCMSDEFYSNIENAELNYSFISAIENRTSRYYYIEGYLYPDTYEFYVGENASSVINTMLQNFSAKWTDEYDARAKELDMTVDEVITMASIIEKEAGSAEQMPTIAAIFYNRLNSSSFPRLQSDATTVYTVKYIKPNVTDGEFNTYAAKYDTYKCMGLPVGPICCPGDNAINAVLYPDDSDAYFFCHDSNGNMYTAKTEAQHNANYLKTLS